MPDLATALRGAEERLTRAGATSPRAEAERLAAIALDVGWGGLWSRLRDELDARSADALGSFVARRERGEPLAYIEGSVVFHGLELACGPGVLVPRPETETLVDVALDLLATTDRPLVVDVGTGTGAVALAIVKARPDADVWATDISPEALEWARRNADASRLEVSIAEGDLLDALPRSLAGALDLVVSNPPYVPDGAELPADVRSEPASALFAGPRGDEVLLRLAGTAATWLRGGGSIALEVGTPAQARAVERAIGAAGFASTGVRDDATDRPRVVWATS